MKIQGLINNIKGNVLHGWVADFDLPSVPLEVEIFINGKCRETTKADKPRPAVKKNTAHPTGKCGFVFNIGPHLKEEILYVIHVGVVGSDVRIKNSPIYLDMRGLSNRVLIVGLNKSGTTILTYRVAAGMPTNKINFEPCGKDCLNDVNKHVQLTNSESIVTKCLFYHDLEHQIGTISRLYDKKIWIVRDPRDVLISSFFYKWYKKHDPQKEKFEVAYKRTLEKEANPAGMTFFEMTQGLMNIPAYLKNTQGDFIQTLKRLDTSWLICKYEDFIDNKLDDINQYLGFEIDTTAEVDPKMKRVNRSKSHSNWRLWYTEKELPQMKRLFNPTLKKLGYDPMDWELQSPERLDPAKGSEYMAKLFQGGL